MMMDSISVIGNIIKKILIFKSIYMEIRKICAFLHHIPDYFLMKEKYFWIQLQ